MTREVEARLKISAVDRTGKVFQSLAGKLQQVNRQAAALNRQQSLVGRGTASMMAAVGRFAAPAVVAYGAKKAITEFASVERQMTRIGITADASAAETEAAFSRMQDITKTLAMPVENAISALDTLVSSGLSLKEALAFLPSVLATAQASGSAAEDIANTAIKASSALKIEAGEMQRAFDIMVTGGKAGQFELKDMATYIPELANSFASLGYEGEDGLKKLIAILQTLREDTGSASGAATQAQNVFGKMFTADTAKKFAGFGINLRAEMEAAKKSGEDAVAAFVRLSKEAVKGDLSKLPLLFTDQEFRLGMQSLMTSADSYKRFVDAVNSSQVEGTVLRDLQKVTGDTQASIDRLSNSWSKLMTSFGAAASKPASTVMDAVSEDLDYGEAVRRGLEKRGMSYWERETWMLKNMPLGSFSRDEESDQVAFEGGLKDPEFLKNYHAGKYLNGSVKPSVGRQGQPVVTTEFPGSRGEGAPVPRSRPEMQLPAMPKRLEGVPPALRPAPEMASMGQLSGDFFRVPSRQELRDAFKIDATGLKRSERPGAPVPRSRPEMASMGQLAGDVFRVPSRQELRDAFKVDATGLKRSERPGAQEKTAPVELLSAGDEAAEKVAESGRAAGEAIEKGAAFFKVAGVDVGAALQSAAEKMLQAANKISNAQITVANAAISGKPRVNADTGRSMSAVSASANGGGGF